MQVVQHAQSHCTPKVMFDLRRYTVTPPGSRPPSHCRLSSSSHCALAPRYYRGVNVATSHRVFPWLVPRQFAASARLIYDFYVARGTFTAHTATDRQGKRVINPPPCNNSPSAHNYHIEPQKRLPEITYSRGAQPTYSSNPISTLAEIGA